MLQHTKDLVKLSIVVFCLSVASDVSAETTQYYPITEWIVASSSSSTASILYFFTPSQAQVESALGTTTHGSNKYTQQIWTVLPDDIYNVDHSIECYNFSGGTNSWFYGLLNTKNLTEDIQKEQQSDYADCTAPGVYYLTQRDAGTTFPVAFYVSWFYEGRGSGFTEQATSTLVSGSVQCETCTRIINIDPGGGEATASSTYFYATVEYYLSSEDNGFFDGTPYLVYEVTHTDGTKETYEQQIIQEDTEISQNILLLTITKTGSYSETAWIESRPVTILGASIFGSRDLSATYYTNFYVGTTSQFATSSSSYSAVKEIIEGAYGAIQCEWNILSPDFDCLLQYVYRTFIPPTEALKTSFEDTLDVIFLMPPWGYATQALVTLMNPATTSVLTADLSFASTSVAYGKTLTLDPLEGITKFENSLSGLSTTFDGTYLDQLKDSWETLWWTVFAFWLVGSIVKLSFIGTNQSWYKDDTRYENFKEKNMRNRSHVATGYDNRK